MIIFALMSKRINLKPDEAVAILGYSNSTGRYKFSESKIEEIRKKREELRGKKEIDIYCENAGIDKDTISVYWDKSENFSILVRPDAKERLTDNELIDRLSDKLKSHSPIYETFEREEKKENNLLVIDISDAHFGKLCSNYETGATYDLTTATKRCIDGVNGIVKRASVFDISKIMLVIGNDVLHIDNPRRTTTSGTSQDTSGMWYDAFNAAIDAHVKIIDSLLERYDVDIVFCPSNHDYMSGWMFARTLSAWYRTSGNVNVDDSISHRKYYKFGNNLIGLSHGDGAKMADMPLLMANEVPKMWSETQYRYVFLHHIHHHTKNYFNSGKDYIGVTVQYLRSPSESDSWHHRNGYTGAKKAVEAFIHNDIDGQIASIVNYF